jgi:hypothetical protein
LSEAIKRGKFYDPDAILESERERFTREVGALLGQKLACLGRVNVLPTGSFARFELARPNSHYESYAVHQDAAPVFELSPDSWTCWLALSQCGKDAPSLQYVDRKFSKILPAQEGRTFINLTDIQELHFERPILNPGDMVVFSGFTVHGTWIERRMTKPRFSLDIRVAAA